MKAIIGWDDSVLVSYKSSSEELEAADGAPIGMAMGQRPTPLRYAEWNNDQRAARIRTASGRDLAVICEPMRQTMAARFAGFPELLREITR